MYCSARIRLLMLSCLIYSVSCQDTVNNDYYDYDVETPIETKDPSTNATLIEIPLLEFPVKETVLESQQEMNTESPIIETATTKSKSKTGRKRKLVQPRRRPSNASKRRPEPVERPTKKAAEPNVEVTSSGTEEVKKTNKQNTRGRNPAGSSRFNRNRSRPSSSSSPSAADNDNAESSATTETSRRIPGRRRSGSSRPSTTRASSSQQQKEGSDGSTTSKATSSSGRRAFRPSNRQNDHTSVTSTEAPETTIASTHRFRGGSRSSSSRSRLNGRRSFEPSPVTTNDGPQEETVDEQEAKSFSPSSSSNSRFGRRG